MHLFNKKNDSHQNHKLKILIAVKNFEEVENISRKRTLV